MNLIGFDFSINKPAACIYSGDEYYFCSWPYGVPEKYTKIFSDSGVHIAKREDNKEKGNTLSSKMNYEVKNAEYLADLITSSLHSFLNKTTYIAFEGLSYASSGDVGVQLGGYKYMLMYKLSKYIPYDNMFTYSPISIKSIAECSKRGMGKKEMIEKFIEKGPMCRFRTKLFEHPELFQSPKAKNWIIHLDDLVDGYWTLETLRKKQNL
jgi:hypothetical protein